ncbi:hypothetical protein [Companilactobacillus kimchii]|uniref:ABC transporter permease n=2 Tax=Companilactobacillus kimchii TaxID=2801452 RepID=A0ABR5NTT0_9LACO|nr:hypothetical protein [Companilactobacillus kimchii]KAE9558646.1 hypothetical protein ATN91_13660 [Companilactobacillus kimchii]KRK51775.1 hypothetical protein FC97_GL000568 [Companilactobacillus kimchii DSM 13961 = JCM 10707]OWF33938.1 hypothetical protein LKACC12383_00548 [Companilactobacillus kimchii]GEO47152.1 hypothetical protein LKI01_11510 [Companilactobacillus paralimentarius]
MSNFWGVSKNLMWNKFKLMNWILVIDAIAIVVIFFINLFKMGYSSFEFIPVLFISSIMIVNFVSVVMLSRVNERVLTSSNYRLIPISDTKLYLSNILTTFLATVYLWIVETVINGLIDLIAIIIKYSKYKQFNNNISSQDIMAAIQLLLFMALATIVVWSGITLIHFIVNLVSGFLPFGRQKFVLFLVYLVVIGLSLWAFNYIMFNIFTAFYQNDFQIDTVRQLNSTLWIGSGIACVWIALFSVINIYLMKRWIETVR